MGDLRKQIEDIVADAAARIAALFKESASELLSAFAETNGAQPTRGQRARAPAAARSQTTRRGKGAKRPKAEIDALANKVGTFILKHPGLRIEQINKELGTTTKDLMLPLKKLIAERKVKTNGAKRATTYHPAKR